MKLLICVFITLLFISCDENSSDRKDGFSDNSKNPEDSLFQDVMDEHDEAMSKMGRLSGYRKQFNAKVDSLKKTSGSAKATLQEKYQELSAELKHAEDGMNRWMEEFSIDSAQDDIERRLKYLESEKVKVRRVKEEILSVIARADSALKK